MKSHQYSLDYLQIYIQTHGTVVIASDS